MIRPIIVTPKSGVRHHHMLEAGVEYPATYTKIGVLPTRIVVTAPGWPPIEVTPWTVDWRDA